MRKRHRRILCGLSLALSFFGPAVADPWSAPSVDALKDDAWGRAVRYGRELTVATASLIGPETADPARRFAGNNLSCQSCHLNAGASQFALPFVGVFADFPQYRPREGIVGTIEDRINGCMTRSMNGRELPVDGAEMRAIVAYMKFLSDGIPVGAATPGRGTVMAPMAPGNATGSPATVAVMCFRRFGDRTASTTAPAWPGSLPAWASSMATCRSA